MLENPSDRPNRMVRWSYSASPAPNLSIWAMDELQALVSELRIQVEILSQTGVSRSDFRGLSTRISAVELSHARLIGYMTATAGAAAGGAATLVDLLK
jgi:hypothetical protein